MFDVLRVAPAPIIILVDPFIPRQELHELRIKHVFFQIVAVITSRHQDMCLHPGIQLHTPLT